MTPKTNRPEGTEIICRDEELTTMQALYIDEGIANDVCADRNILGFFAVAPEAGTLIDPLYVPLRSWKDGKGQAFLAYEYRDYASYLDYLDLIRKVFPRHQVQRFGKLPAEIVDRMQIFSLINC